MNRSRARLNSLSTAAIALLGATMGGAAVVLAWYFGDTTMGAAVVHFLPVSDALGYHGCATSIAATGQLDEFFGVDWCARRVLYPTMLASLLAATSFSSQLALVLQGSLIGLAIAVFSLQARAIVGVSGALFTAALLLVFAWEFTIGVFLTEVVGFSLGLFGLTLLMSFGETKRVPLLFAGAAALSVALMARAGAMFVLPAIVIWSLLVPGSTPQRQRLIFLTVSIVGISIGPLLQFAMAIMFGADPFHSGGNFSTTLYGLSTGSRDWTEAYRHFDADFKLGETRAFKQIYTAAFHNISERPHVFAASLLEAARVYWGGLFAFGVTRYFNPILTGLAALGVLRCLIALRYPWARLLLILGAAEAFASPLIIGGGDIRVFAATVPIRFLFAALGLHLITSGVTQALRPASIPEQPSPICDRGPATLALSASVVVLLMMIGPAIATGRLSRVQPAPTAGCPSGLTEVISHLGKESQMLSITDRATTIESLQPFRIGRQRLLNDDTLATSWLGPYLLGLRLPLTIVHAVDRSSGAPGSIKYLVFAGEFLPSDYLLSLCVDSVQHVDFANVKHYFIRSVQRSDVR